MMLSGSRALLVSGQVGRDVDPGYLGRDAGAHRPRLDEHAAQRAPDAPSGRRIPRNAEIAQTTDTAIVGIMHFSRRARASADTSKGLAEGLEGASGRGRGG
jgi:hypothetical protein